MSYAIEQKPRMRAADGWWLIIAVVAHALLLAIPIKKVAEMATLPPANILVRLVVPPPMQHVEPETMAQPSEVATESPLDDLDFDEVVPTAKPRPIPESPPSEPLEASTTDLLDAPVLPDAPAITTAHLIDQRDTVAEPVPVPDHSVTAPRRLGTPEKYEVPPNWQPHAGAQALAPFDNTFNGKTVPESAEVVDRWLAADGSHNVVVETPAGLKLCGRARAQDPLNPLVESVMMWKVCGGDGRRPFDFKPRKPLDRDFIVPMAKDATEP